MAYDKIIPVTSRLDHCMDYVQNPEKTDLSMVLDYISDEEKTIGVLVDGINCDSQTAYAEMQATKRRWGKCGGVLGYHLIHSYAPGEVTPEQAHAIGMEFARRLLGERYEAVVATHIDREHLHCHILFNSVSFVDGRKYRNQLRDYYGDIRGISNEVSAAHGLSVIQTDTGGKHYAEWNAEQTGKPTIRNLIRRDIDSAIGAAFTMKTFWAELERIGYEVKRGNVKHIALKPPGGTRFIRLSSLGSGYSEDEIKERLSDIRTGQRKEPLSRAPARRKRYVVIGKAPARPRKKLKGFAALYVRYLYLLGVRRPYKKRVSVPFAVRQEVTKLHRYQRQFRFIRQNHIEDAGQLTEKTEALKNEIDALIVQRKELYREKRKGGDAEHEIADINARMRLLRRDLWNCRKIAEDSPRIQAQMEALRAEQQKQQTTQEKEANDHGCKWRSR
ncbi:relaxase/mobilization nuclease domain-containing protein [Intestinimonas sp. MSJ-38]|uniref:relaxase/mobilization nuclease domain-containing protein n=1 Tax=Intestinimonas sp. MSJ-38 TaxID=2841532 RepID=UPI001C0FCBD5|nr:relaxase/mobilization nuclease domain-containing protein [Intestinimonas sp. MSJ-38]MBU5433366.1 relaxase/mobilization nuclease domain-containing protein [Intestinimonas sp. MSJ-38]